MKLYGKRWPQDFRKRFFVGQHMIDTDQNENVPEVLKGVKPREIVRQLADVGCDLLYFYMSCHMGNCYYPTKVKWGRIHSGARKIDIFGEVADECVKQKIALFTVFEFAHLHYLKDWKRAPEDWKHYRRREDGTRGVSGLCWNTGYGEFVHAQIEEVFSTYPTYGLYVDMFDYPGLNLCPECARRFREEMGEVPPTQDTDINSPLFREYKMWAFREEARGLKEIRQTVHRHVPEAVVLNNYHRLKCEDLYELRDAVDFVSTDPGIGFGYQSVVRATHTAAVFCALSEGKLPFDILYDDVTYGLLEIAPRDPYLGIASTALAHGGIPCPCSMWAKDGSLNQAALGLSREVYQHVDRTKKWVGGWRSLKVAGVYLSQESEYFHGHPGEKTWGLGGGYQDEFDGALMMLQEEHVLTDVLTRNQLPRLSDYPVIYLPNAVCLSDVEVAAFREYVRKGGTLIASHSASLADEWGSLGEDFRLADVFGVDWTGEKMEPYIAVQMNVASSKRFPFLPWENPSVTVNQAGLIVKARKGAKVLATLHDRYRPNTDPKKFSGFHNAFVVEKPAGPAIVENRFGKGRAIYFAPRVFAAYAYQGIPEIRKLVARWLVGSRLSRAPIRLDAPSSVEMTAFERPEEGQWVIHLVNFQSIPARAYLGSQEKGVTIPLTEDVLPVRDLVLRARLGKRSLKQVSLQPSGKRLKAVKQGAETIVHIPEVHIHEIVVFEFKEPWKGKPERFTNERIVPMIRCPRNESRKPTSGRTSGKKSGEPANQDSPEAWDGMGMGQAARKKKA